jgi:uncharacterized membrane protein (DUF2068 family)
VSGRFGRSKKHRWNIETLVCSRRGHVTPAAVVARLRPEDAGLGVDLPDGRRFSRCTRCDAWESKIPPIEPAAETLPPLAKLLVPRRGDELREALILRLISIDRGVHSVIFGLLAVVLFVVEADFGRVTAGARAMARSLHAALAQTGQGPSSDFLVRFLGKLGGVQRHAILILLATAAAYCVVEGVEAVGLWRERRWAEYLTALATAGFLPFEVHELLVRVTVFRLLALVLNVAILLWLLWRKRLFGLNGGQSGLAAERRQMDPTVDFAPPRSALSAHP